MTFAIKTDRFKTIKVETRSSLVDSMEYSREACCLIVTYKKGGIFGKKVKRFDEVSPGQFFDLLNAESVGRALMRLVKESRMDKSY